MGRGMKKSERLREMERLYFQHRGGLTDIELAERFGVDRTTIFRDRTELECEIPLQEAATGRYTVDRMKYISAVRLNLTEALALYLAARRMSRHTRTYQAHVVSALEKLAVALKEPMTEHLVHAATTLEQQPPQPERVRILETLTRGWAEHIQVRLTYQGLRADRPTTHLFSPYLIEPSIWSDAIYVIGYSDVFDALTTFSVERIQEAHLSTAPFTIPETFDEQELLRFTWGIWTSQKEPVTVRLKFTGSAAITRLKESIWHPLQKPLVGTVDGGCLWEAQVAEPREMLPWIRGWGGDVEVLEPEGLREMLVREVRKMARVYGISNEPPTPIYQLLWAKLSRDKTRSHPLICHLLDVAAVTQVLWREALTDGQRTAWSTVFGLDTEAVGRLFAFWAALHDLGKASPAFQRQWREAESLFGAALPFPKRFTNEFCPHGLITAIALPEALVAETCLPQRAAKQLARALGGHHGAWPTPHEEQNVKSDERGGAEWDTIRRELVQVLRKTLQPSTPTTWPFARTADVNAFLTWFSGLVSVADWIGSMETYFPYVEAPLDPAKYYAQQVTEHAPVAFQALRWPNWQPPTEACSFETLFPFITDGPSPMQQAVIELADQLDQPALVLIEAPTGSGKTEAALYLADTWARALQQRGLYVAMPTMATSNQMWERVGNFLKQRHGGDVEPLLVHSQARWVVPPPEPTLQEEGQETEVSAATALAWFLPRKKSLLAPYAVGTVDQALLSVLQARHFFVRLFGLSDKTVIFDEIHAYDTYMSTIFQRLLGWLRAMRASVVLLSATLPAQTRRELLAAYAGQMVDVPEVDYPAIAWATADGKAGATPLPTPIDHTLALHWLNREPATIVDVLREALREGGCAAVICNTVARAQEVYAALKEAKIVPEADLTLFHARFPFGWRDEREKGVLARFGKTATRENGKRPERAIVVATQVIEQSLDLDFDIMVSDLAPVDLLVQRAGRLHRHPRQTRPAPVAAPRLCVAVDAAGDAAPDWDRDRYIYAPYLLLRTYLTLRGRASLTLPGEVSPLIETVYGDIPLPETPSALLTALETTRLKMEQSDAKDEFDARKRLVAKPTFDGLLNDMRASLEEDAPDIHKDFQALTRLGPPSISLVCLHQTPTGLNTDPDSSGATVDLKRKPDDKTTEAIARATVNISRREVLAYFQARAESRPPAWRKHALLRDHYVAEFNALGLCPIGENLALRLTREMGLEVVKL